MYSTVFLNIKKVLLSLAKLHQHSPVCGIVVWTMKWIKASNFVPNFFQRKNEIGAKKKSVHLQSNKTLKVMIRIQSLVFKVINVLLGEGTVTPFFFGQLSSKIL